MPDDVVIEHPNRKKAASKATRFMVLVLLLASAFLIALITLTAWDQLLGARAVQVIFILVYLVLAWQVVRWSRGVLPVSAALGIVMLIFALVSVPGWFERDQPGFTEPTLPADVIGMLTALLIPIQLLLIVFAMRGFQQAWNVEVEHPADARRPRQDPGGGPAPAAA
jgi:hypothetical protein